MKKTIRDIQARGKRILVRVDFNVPMQDGEITDDRRIIESLPTIRHLLENGARVILASHLGRPKGGPDPKYSLKPCAIRLSELLAQPVAFAPDCIGLEVERMAAAMHDGDVLVLENVRFHPEEEKNDPAFSEALAKVAEVYVNDAFGSAHRAHASTEGVTKFLNPCVGGFLMEEELQYLAVSMSN
ncbi:MAG: phosphoglycerate kinase, partial [bacterium]|nr:phosphoglycerate kinase [bacterium]